MPDDEPRRTDYPPRIRVGTVTYRVSTDPDEWVRAEHGAQMTNSFGHTDNTAAVIVLNPDHPDGVRRQTLWHEVLHALHWTVMGAPDWRGLGKDADAREETVIKSWEHPTLAVLRDNPGLVAYLTAE